jgi:hypothetical protein
MAAAYSSPLAFLCVSARHRVHGGKWCTGNDGEEHGDSRTEANGENL